MSRRRPTLAGTLALLITATLVAPVHARHDAATTVPAPALTDSLRLDPLVRTGVLDNGLRWYVRRNGRPERRVSLRLAVAAGSTAEREDQRGLAHFVEHMSFNGSEHFKPEEMVAYLEAIGLRFGADANAYTSFDETVYKLEVPTDRDTLLDRGLMALADFAGRATLSADEIEKERGVLLEEWRRGLGAADRVWRRQMPVLYHGSRYVRRLPIGLPDVIRKAPAARLRDFYRTWYTPDRMALVVVGDVDTARIDSLIRLRFGGLPRPARSPRRPLLEIPLHEETLVSVATDKEIALAQAGLLFKRPLRPVRTVGDARDQLIEELCTSMMDERFSELGHRSDAPFLWAGASSGTLGRTLETWSVHAAARDIGATVTALLRETARVRLHGFLASELARARERLRTADERAWAERDRSESAELTVPYLRNFLSGAPAAGLEARHRRVQSLLDGVTIEEVNACAARLAPATGRVVTVAAAADQQVPTEAEVRRLVAEAERAPLPAWADDLAGSVLMESLPAPGRVAGRRQLADSLGVTMLTLSNGVEAWLKPTDFKADEILFGACARGGASLVDSASYLAADLAPLVVARCGAGGYTAVDLQKLLSGRMVNVMPYVSDYVHGWQGWTRPADLEAALQLAYLQLTAPHADTASFVGMRQGFRQFLVERGNSPVAAYEDTLAAVNSGGFYMDVAPAAAQMDSLRLDAVLALHRRLFANAADFDFVMVGAFQVDLVAPLLERYVASLPSTGRRVSELVPVGPRRPATVRQVAVRRDSEPKATTRITFFTDAGIEERDRHRALSCASILQDNLRRSLREMLGGTYHASAAFGTREPRPGYARMTIEFGCAPGRVDSMVAAALADVRRLREEGPSEADVQREQEMQRRELEVNLRENGWWYGELLGNRRLRWDPARIAKDRELIEALSPADLRETFRAYFPLDRYTVVSLLPAPGVTAKE